MCFEQLLRCTFVSHTKLRFTLPCTVGIHQGYRLSRVERFCYTIIHVLVLVTCCTPTILPVIDVVSGHGSSTSANGCENGSFSR